MSKMSTTARTRRNGGKWYRVGKDARKRRLADRPADWSGFDSMTGDEITAAARSDPDNPPRQDYAPGGLKRVPRVKVMRRALGLTQEEFSARFRILLGTLRDWEQGKTEPDQAARAYLSDCAQSSGDLRTRSEVRRALHRANAFTRAWAYRRESEKY